jgi:hypothetical protein
MKTNRAIEEMSRWASSAIRGDRSAASDHLREFYHIGAAFVASQEFQGEWKRDRANRLDPEHLDFVCKFLATIAEIEASQVDQYGPATAAID